MSTSARELAEALSALAAARAAAVEREREIAGELAAERAASVERERALAAERAASLERERALAAELAASVERERALAAERAASVDRERELAALRALLVRLQVNGAADASGAGGAAPGAAPARRAFVPALMDKKKAASGFALAKSGLDAPVGWMLAAAVFMPEGRIADEVTAATAEAAEAAGETAAEAGDDGAPCAFSAFRAGLDLIGGLALSRSLETLPEKPLQVTWDEDVQRWWPNVVSAGLSSTSERPETFPVPLVLGSACEVDFLRKVILGEGAGRQVAVVAVAELKNSCYSPLNGVPQALVAAFSAAVDLRSKGLPAAQCVVPFLSSNGALEQYGAAYLLEPNLPCAALTTPVLDLSDADGQRSAEAARWAFRRMADSTTALLQELRRAPATADDAADAADAAAPGAKSAPAPALDVSRYHVKAPLHFVGRSVEQSVLQQLRVFERLRRSPAAGSVVLPAAVLMQDPTAAIQAAADARAAGASGKVESAPHAARAWQRTLAVAFPMLEGFSTGIPDVSDPRRPAVLAALRNALRRVHRAGVVHLDLFPGNILWASGAGGAGSAGSAGDAGNAGDAGGAGVALRLIDFDAALEVGQRVPALARDIVERNGHKGSYHPGLFVAGAHAQAGFDWWHFCLLADGDCPFARNAAALPAWLDSTGARERLLAQVAAEEAAELEAVKSEEAAGSAGKAAAHAAAAELPLAAGAGAHAPERPA